MRTLLSRVAAATVLVWLVASLVFVLVRLAPGDPAALLVPPDASPGDVARLRAELGLDRPLVVQYVRWSVAVARGDLGESFQTRRPVSRTLAEALPLTLLLGALSLALTFVLGVVFGTLQAAWRGRLLDAVLTAVGTAAYAAPSYWLALALVAVFTFGVARWHFPMALRLPAFGVRDPAGTASGLAALADRARHLVLPVTVLTASGAGGIARYARQSVGELADADWVRTARAKGLAPTRVFGRHLLANALPPLVVLLALSLPGVIAGSVFVESVFGLPGMGRTMLMAIATRDYPVVLGATLLYGATVIAANLAADLALPLLDPRRRER